MNPIDRLRKLVIPELANLPEEALIAIFQHIHGLRIDGQLGPVTQSQIMRPRACGVKDRVQTTRARWDFTTWDGTKFIGAPAAITLTYHMTASVPGQSMQATKDSLARIANNVRRACAVNMQWTDEPKRANVLIKTGKIDGPSGTLAWAELPEGQQTPSSVLNSLVDKDERFTISESPGNILIDFQRVMEHELGHILGLPHLPAGNLLQPYYSEDISTYQKGDIDELQRRYGPPVPDVTPPVPPTGNQLPTVLTLAGTTYDGFLVARQS